VQVTPAVAGHSSGPGGWPGPTVLWRSPVVRPAPIATIMFEIAALAHIHIRIDGLQWPSAGVVVGCLALGFTIGSFWWLNARQGRQKSVEPRSFAAALTLQGEVRLRFPLVVQNMRLSFPKEPGSMPLHWTMTRARIKPTSDDGHEFQPCSPYLADPLCRRSPNSEWRHLPHFQFEQHTSRAQTAT
jgi:hypothetical protein